jgi:putative membrane protein
MRFLAQILTNAIGLLIARYYVPGIDFTGDFKVLLVFGAVLGLINFFLKPILKFIFGPLIILSLGIFGLLINALMLWLATKFIPELTINGFMAYIYATLIMTVLNIVVAYFLKKEGK